MEKYLVKRGNIFVNWLLDYSQSPVSMCTMRAVHFMFSDMWKGTSPLPNIILKSRVSFFLAQGIFAGG